MTLIKDTYRLYYRRVEEGQQFPVLCRRLASLNEEFVSHKSPFAGFDYISGKRIEQKLIDYNKEAERFGGFFLLLLCCDVLMVVDFVLFCF